MQYFSTFNIKEVKFKMKKILIALIVLSSSYAFAGREESLQQAINQVGDSCQKVTQIFQNGKDKDGNLHMSVACSGGENYYVILSRVGEAKVMRCALIDKLAGGRGKAGSCFTKY
jgi:hypothetical protein